MDDKVAFHVQLLDNSSGLLLSAELSEQHCGANP